MNYASLAYVLLSVFSFLFLAGGALLMLAPERPRITLGTILLLVGFLCAGLLHAYGDVIVVFKDVVK
jgi:hypothetical protein